MIDFDDIENPDGEPLVWVEYSVRLLTTRRAPEDGCARTLSQWFQYEYEQARDIDAQARSPLGALARCTGKGAHCNQAAIDTDGFPFGRDQYKRDDTDPVYCPHCDGAEDIG